MTMFEITDNTIATLDLAEEFFCCDLEACRGACCVEGDAGAPITPGEDALIRRHLPAIKDELPRRARERIDEADVSYVDEEGDLVTQIIDGRDCVFTCRSADGCTLCAFDRAFRQGRIPWRKPASCSLYPLRLSQIGDYTAINYHRWNICAPARRLGRERGIRLYQFLKEPLTEFFGAEWYEQLRLTCEAYLKESHGE